MKNASGIIIRHTVALLIIFAFAALTASAQTTDKPQANSLIDGAWALQFEIDEDLDLKSFEGTTFSLKKHTSAGSAWRLALSLGFRFDDNDRSSTTDGDPSGTTKETDEDTQSIVILVNHIKYPNPNAKVIFFYGFGPKLAYSHSKYITSSDRLLRYSESQTSTDSYSVGVLGIVGIEWFATKSISLLGEYGSTLVGSISKETRQTTRRLHGGMTRRFEEKDKDSGISFDASSVKLGLTAYF